MAELGPYRIIWVSPHDAVPNLEWLARQAQQWGWRRKEPQTHLKLMIKACDGTTWMGRIPSNNQTADIRPRSPDDLAVLRMILKVNFGIEMGCWVNVREASLEEAHEHRQAAQATGLIALDVEPYSDEDGFPWYLLPPYDRDPTEYLSALWGDEADFEVALSIVPLPSGLDPLGDALKVWLDGCTQVQPQCYWTDNPDLHPRIAIPYLRRRMRTLGIHNLPPIVPLIPHPLVCPNPRTAKAGLARRRGDVAVWRAL